MDVRMGLLGHVWLQNLFACQVAAFVSVMLRSVGYHSNHACDTPRTHNAKFYLQSDRRDLEMVERGKSHVLPPVPHSDMSLQHLPRMHFIFTLLHIVTLWVGSSFSPKNVPWMSAVHTLVDLCALSLKTVFLSTPSPPWCLNLTRSYCVLLPEH